MMFRPHAGGAAGMVLAVALATGAWLAVERSGDAGHHDGARRVSDEAVAAAVASEVPTRRTMSDEIEHYEARLARRGDEGFSHARLHSAHLLRFRAYGDTADLAAAASHLDGWEAGGGSPVAVGLARTSLRLTQHRFADALAAAHTAKRNEDGRNPETNFSLFDVAWATGLTAEAEKALERPADSTSIAYLSRRARLLDRQGDVHAARDLIRRVVKSVKAYAEPPAVQAWALVELGHYEHHAGDPELAVARYREALDVLPGDAAAIEGLAAVARGVDRNADVAAGLYRLALDRGGHLDIMPVLADVEASRGRLDEAAAIRARFVRLATADEQALRWYRRPLTFVLAEQPATTCQALSLALQDFMERQDAGAWDAIAWARFRLGDLEGARSAAAMATATGVPEPGVALRAGMILRAAGESRADGLLRIAKAGAMELSAGDANEVNRLLEGGVVRVPPPTECGSDAVAAVLR